MPANTIILAAIAAFAAMPTVASAAPTAAATAAAVAPAASTATSRADNPSQRYCIEMDHPASRIRRIECDKLSGWQSQGVDPRLLPRRK